jgi:predicted MFS family arabinose efflux permease
VAGPRVVVALLCGTTFFVSTTGTAIAPFLLVMAQELGTSLAAVANLIALLSVTWGLVSLLAGSASDRIGRRPILLAAVLVLSAGRLGLASAPSYGWAVAWQLLSGLGGGAFMGTVFAAVAEQMPQSQRGRALGWVMTGMSLAMVFGVPVLTWLGGWAGWRGATVAHGLATAATLLPLWLILPRQRAGAAGAGALAPSLLGVVTPRVAALLGAGVMERICFVSLAVYLATYLIQSYAVGPATLAVGLGLVAVGNLGGNLLGGTLADRLPARPLTFAASALLTGGLGLPLLLWQPGLAASLALGFAYSLANSLGRPSLMAALSEVPAGVRGAVLGLNITMSSFGWLGSTALGGWLMAIWGFPSLAVLCAASGVAGAGLGVTAWIVTPRGVGK